MYSANGFNKLQYTQILLFRSDFVLERYKNPKKIIQIKILIIVLSQYDSYIFYLFLENLLMHMHLVYTKSCINAVSAFTLYHIKCELKLNVYKVLF